MKNKTSKKVKSNKNTKDNNKKGLYSVENLLFIAVSVLVPLSFSSFTLLPLGLNKQLVAAIFLLGILAYVLAKFIAKGKITLPPPSILFIFIGLFLAVLLSALFSQARSTAFIGNSTDSLFWVSMYIIGFFAAIFSLKKSRHFKLLLGAFLPTSVLVAVYFLLQLSEFYILPWEFTKIPSFNTIGGVFPAGFFIAAIFVALVSYATYMKLNKRDSILLWSVALLFFTIIVQLNFLIIWLAIAVALAVVSVILGYGMIKEDKVYAKRFIIPFSIIAISLFFLVIKPEIPSFFTGTAEIGVSLRETFSITTQSLNGARWLVGTGPDTFVYNYALNRSVELNEGAFWSIQLEQGYSAISTYFLTLGILGAGVLIGVLIWLSWTLLKGALVVSYNFDKLEKYHSNKTDVRYLYGIVVSSFAYSLVLAVAMFAYRGNAVLHLFMFMGFGVALAGLIKLKGVKPLILNFGEKPQYMILSSLASLLIISFAFGGFYLVAQRYVANIYLAQANRSFSDSGNIEESIDKLQKALDINSSDDLLLRAASQALVLQLNNIINNQDLTQAEAGEQFSNALQNAVLVSGQATDINPKNSNNWIQLALVYSSAIGYVDGAEDLAVQAYDEAIKRDPYNPALPLSQAEIYITAADFLQTQLSVLAQSGESTVKREQEISEKRGAFLNSAIEKSKESLELKSNYISARLLIAASYERLGELDKAIEETELLVRTSPNDSVLSFQLGLLYYKKEDYGSAKREFERAIVLAQDKFGNARYYLGLTLYELGDALGAKAQFAVLKEDNSENQLVLKILDNLNDGRAPFDELLQDEVAPPIGEESEIPIL